MKNTIHWGIIGCGNVTEVKSGPAFKKVPHSSLYAVMRRNSEKAKDYAQRHQVPTWYDDASQLINDSRIDAVYIATPTVNHATYAIEALSKGKPVYVEKPVALSVAELDTMQKAVDQYQGKLTVAHYRRALPLFIKIQQLIHSGAIGKVKTIQLELFQPATNNMIASAEENWRIDPAISGGGLFYDLAPHQLDIIVHLFGAPLEVAGFAANQSRAYAAEDAVTGSLLLPNDVLFQGSWNFDVPNHLKSERCRIFGADGMIEFAFFGNYILLETTSNTERFDFQHPAHIQQPMIEQVVAYFRGEGPNPCSLSDARHSLLAMEKMVYGDKKFNPLKFKLL